MAQQKRTQQTRNTGRTQMDQDMDMNTDDEQTTSRSQNAQAGRGTQRSQQARGTQAQGGRQLAQRSNEQDQQPQSPVDQILATVTPAFQEARTYIEGSPVRAAAIGAVAGGLLMTLFSTEKGRQFVKMAYDYANPMVAKYAKDYIAQAAGNMTEQAIAQH